MQREIQPDEDVSEAVVAAVAEETGRDPESLGPFVESIDSAAVDSLLEGASGDGPRALMVAYEGCRVTIEGDAVTVEPLTGG